MLGRHPMDGALHLTAIGRIATSRCGVVATVEQHHLSVGILLYALAPDEIAVTKPYLCAGRQAVELLGGHLHKILPLYVEFSAEGDLPGTSPLILGVIHRLQPFYLPLGIGVYNHFQRIQHPHAAKGALIEVFAEVELQQREVYNVIALGHAHGFGKSLYRLGGIATPAKGAYGGQARIVPTCHHPCLHQL